MSSKFRMGRGLFIVLEGLDRSGKSTQCKLLEESLQAKGYAVRLQRYPDRSEPSTGAKIDEFLRTAKDVKQDALLMHNLFAENRAQLDAVVREAIGGGQMVVADRYSFSGVAYSAAKELAELSLAKACESEVGLLRPDLVLFLDANADVTARREGFGGEALEKADFQAKVYENIGRIFNPDFWTKVDASGSIQSVQASINAEVEKLLEKPAGEVQSFQLADFNIREPQQA